MGPNNSYNYNRAFTLFGAQALIIIIKAASSDERALAPSCMSGEAAAVLEIGWHGSEKLAFIQQSFPVANRWLYEYN